VARVRPSAPSLRWVDEGRLHLTLVFLGPVDDALRPGLADRLDSVARRHPPVIATLAGVGRFGHRVLWAGVAGELAPLASGVRRAAGKAGIADLDPRPLRAHLTLARAREARRPGRGARDGAAEGTDRRGGAADRADDLDAAVDLRPIQAALGELPEVTWTIDRFDLMSSVLGPHPRYTVEETWRLTGR
jgi:2'-5' RNA ligase